jgi:hypothetical protein
VAGVREGAGDREEEEERDSGEFLHVVVPF